MFCFAFIWKSVIKIILEQLKRKHHQIYEPKARKVNFISNAASAVTLFHENRQKLLIVIEQFFLIGIHSIQG